ncbi:MAG: hypothetical protein J7M05_08275 [Anaerolineae bacterium]|nr:hypothetical protein [Anaerolineae bacterium]
MGLVTTEELDVLLGPGAEWEALGRVREGAQLYLLGRDISGKWLFVTSPVGKGWVLRRHVRLKVSLGTLPLVATPSLPPCPRSVDQRLSDLWERARLGCPIDSADVLWAAWQPFENGYMLWRSDVRQILVFYADGTWANFPDRWQEGMPIPSRGNPPPGRVAPVRGFGLVWGSHEEVAKRLGWALEEEKGFCATVQSFQRGFIFRSNRVRYCLDELYNWATHPSFKPLFFAVYGDGGWQRK